MEGRSVLAILLCVCIPGSLAVESLRFLVIGDMGGIPEYPYYTPAQLWTAKEMGKLADKYGVSFIMELGDNFYFDGVKNVDDPRFKHTFEDVYTAKSLQVPWYLIAGNHDHRGNVSAEIEYSKKSNRWNFPSYYYPLNFKIPNSNADIDFVMMDTITLCGNVHDDFHGHHPAGPDDVTASEKQWTFINKALSTSKATYLFSAGHYPVYSIAEHGPTACLVDRLLPMLTKYKANGHMCGHDHNLQHLRQKTDGVTLDFVLSAAANFVDPSVAHKNDVPAGSSLFHWADLVSLGGLMYGEVTAQNMTVTYIEATGKILFQTVIFPRKL